jgi:hypothetical protein
MRPVPIRPSIPIALSVSGCVTIMVSIAITIAVAIHVRASQKSCSVADAEISKQFVSD